MPEDQVSQNTNNQPDERTKQRSFVFWLVLGLVLIVVDQLSKFLVFRFIKDASPHLFGILPFRNSDLLFGIPAPTIVAIIIYSVIVIVVSAYVLSRYVPMTNLERFAWTLILAGGLSNFLERLLFGSVRDFILVTTGVFNLADAIILFGIAILIISQRKPRI